MQNVDYPIGSRWYSCGHHWLIVAHASRDGEPAVVLKCLTSKPKVRSTVVARLFARRAVPS